MPIPGYFPLMPGGIGPEHEPHNYTGDDFDPPGPRMPEPTEDYPVRCIYHCGCTFPLSKAREHNLERHPMAICIGEGHKKDKRQKRVVEGILVSVCFRCGSLFYDENK